MKKALSILLVICLMLTSLFSFPVFAEGDDVNINANDLTSKTLAISDVTGKYKTQGRTILQNDVLYAHYPATGIEFDAYCKGDVSVTFSVTNLGIDGKYFDGCYFTVIVDGETKARSTCHLTETGDVTVKIAEGLAEGNHTFELYRQNEIKYGYLGFKSITLDGYLLDAPANNDTYIEFVGASQWGAWGNLGDENSPSDTAEVQDATQGLTYLTARNLGADWSVVSVGGIGAYWCGLKYSMSTAYNYYGYENDNTTLYDFDNTRKPDYVVIGVGTNDVDKRGKKTDEEITAAFNYFMRLMRIKNPNAKIIWVHGMMNSLATPFVEEAVEELGGAANGIYEVEVTSNNDGASYHPSVAGHQVIAEEVTAFIKSIENDTFNTKLPEIEYEEAKGETILDLDLTSSSKWVPTSSQVKYYDEDGDGAKDYVRFTSSATSNAGLRSAPFYLIPGNEYELSYYVRVPEESGQFFNNTSKYYPTTALYIPTLDANGKATNSHYESSNEYAYKNKIRTNFTSTWQIGQYAPVTRKNYSNLGSSFFTACAQDSPNKVFDGWTRVTLKFTALDDEANGAVGEQLTAIYFATNANKKVDGLMYDIKDVTLVNKSVRENEEAIVFSDFSDFSDTSKWKVNAASAVHRVKYKDEDGDGVADYVNVNSGANKHSFVTSLPTTLVPGTEYELSYYLRVPSTSADYVSGTTKTFPKISIYQPTIDETTGLISTDYDGYVEGKTEYAYKKLRRTNFESYWQIGDYEPYKRANYSIFSDLHYNACNDVSPNEVYKNWTKVTATFTAIDDEANGAVGPQVVAFRIGVPNTLANVELDIKDLVLIDKSKISTGPEEPEVADAVYYEGFESSPNPTDVVTVYSGANANPSWAKPAIVEGDAATGSKAYSVYAMYQDLFIPFDKAKLQADTVYSFSMDWMLKEYTADKKRKIDNVYIVGYTPTDGVTFAKGHEALGGKGEIQGTGKWENVSFNFKISENKFNEYEQFGIYIAYRTSGSNSETEDKIYLDTITLKVSENQDIINKIELNEAPRTENTIKVLAFGNSFSNDGTSFIPQIAYADGVDLRVADCSIGGCSLAKHYDKSITNDPAYSFYYRTPHQQNTHTKSYGDVTMEQALTASDWDYITIQQVSTLSGKSDSFEPYLGKLIEKFKEYCPNAKIVFQMTWAYRDELVKSGYEYYNNDQETMYNAIIDTYLEYAEKYDVEFIIPSGETIQTLRGLKSDTLFTTEFNATEEEIAAGVNADKGDFTRDGFHLSDKGRVAAAFTWYEIFTGISALDTKIDLTTSAYGTLSNNKGTLIGITAEEALAIKTAAHNAASTYKKAVETTKAIKAIGTVDENSGEAIEKAKALRAELNNDALIVNLQTLLDAIAAFDALLPDDVVGDLDGDGVVELNDVTALARALAGWGNAGEVDLDFNNDDVVNLKDLIILARFVAGWEGVTLG